MCASPIPIEVLYFNHAIHKQWPNSGYRVVGRGGYWFVCKGGKYSHAMRVSDVRRVTAILAGKGTR
jgi:hypothetical protein